MNNTLQSEHVVYELGRPLGPVHHLNILIRAFDSMLLLAMLCHAILPYVLVVTISGNKMLLLKGTTLPRKTIRSEGNYVRSV